MLDQVVVPGVRVDLTEDVELRVPHGEVEVSVPEKRIPGGREASVGEVEAVIGAALEQELEESIDVLGF